MAPCPACHIGMSHWIDGLLEGYSHPYTDKTCVLRGVVIHPCYYAQWNALPRPSEPEWLPIEQLPSEVKNTVPVGFTLIGWCEHGKDPYFLDEGKRLTTYGAHCEGLSRAADGVYAIAWGGEYSDGDELSGQQWTIPSWWFVDDGMFETPVNPTYYKLIPNPPEVTT